MLTRIVGAAAIAAALALGTSAARADVTFTDSSFSGYMLGFAKSQGNATLSFGSCATCGDPGAALSLIITANDGSNLGGAVINPLFTYNPTTQGAIASIDSTVDKNLTVVAPALYGFGNTFRLVIEQDGNFYTSVVFGPSVTVPVGGTTATSGYTGFSSTGLLATDFSEFDVTTGLVGTAHPDFAGDTITFGFGQVLAANPVAAAAGATETVRSDFDNLSITVKSAAASVPEPAAWTLTLSALAVAGLLSPRRHRL